MTIYYLNLMNWRRVYLLLTKNRLMKTDTSIAVSGIFLMDLGQRFLHFKIILFLGGEYNFKF